MGWQRRMRVAAGPLGASGEASDDQPVQVEMFISGAWVDITDYVMVRDDQGNIALNRGIRDEGSNTEQGGGTFPLRNADGRFSPRNPTGPYYGAIGRNTPIRVSVPDGLGGKNCRLWGEVPEWPVSWDTTGTDVWTDVSASGLLRRLAQGPAPARSVIYNAITDPKPSGLVAYWPMEDATGATSLASALTNGSAMTWAGVPTLASYSTLAASDPLPDISAATLSGGVPRYDDPTATQVRFLVYIPASGLADGKVICSIDQQDYSPGAAQFWELYYSTTDASNSLVLKSCDAAGNNLGALLPHVVDVRGRLLYVSVEFQESGANITRQIQLKDVNTSRVYAVSDTEFVTQLSRVTRLQFGPATRSAISPFGAAFLPGVAIGHVTLENQITAIGALGVRLNPIGETAGRRIQRLCGEQGLPFDWVGDLDDTTAMGAQGKSNLLTLVQECVDADGGMLYESGSVLGLGYRTRASLYDQDPTLTLDYPSGKLAQIPTPVEDDRYLQNRVTVTVSGVSQTYEQTGGSLGTAPPPAGVGYYGQDVTLNLAASDASTLQDQAAWRVHLGTVDEARYPQISVNLAHPSITPDMRRAIIGMRIGDRIQITNPPDWLPPDTVDQLVIGTSETITHIEHRVTFNCRPASPYSYVGYLDTAARIDTDGSQLAADIGAGTTVFGVQPTAPNEGLWTKDPGDLPFDIAVGGEVMRVTAVGDAATDTFARTVSSAWGTMDSGFTWTTSGGTSTDYSVSGGSGNHLLASVNISRRCLLAATTADLDMYVSVTADQLATGDALNGGLINRYLDSNNLYHAVVQFTTSNTVRLLIVKRLNGTETTLGSYTMPAVTFSAGTYYRVRLNSKGSLLRAKVWLAADAETPEWQVTVMDTDLSMPQSIGVRSISGASSTNVNPSIKYQSFVVTSPQAFTVTRSINGVVKAHTAGEDLRLANPTILGL
ncbi:hypothetical protein AQI95_24585 [Streptomyces yokosukanensis]|uniref:Uncharacterized protein n=2 Tax=Streptomyces yokosukanensis TaxID=67386 RepID=A0A101P1E3_9ACTN|nr:hypothetical protein AQI95_24585 [Streptomyces yokosukanensis]